MTRPLVKEELELLARVSRLLDELPEPDASLEEPIVSDLRRIREQIIARPESRDVGSLHEQWHQQNALLRQLRASREAPRVDPASPYFGHLRLQEGSESRDLCIGRATCIARGVRIVDWRHAPVSKIFYRYQQGDDYEEEIAGRTRSGEVLARRTLVIRDGRLERIEAPEGVFAAKDGAPGGWQRIRRGPARLAGGEGSALRVHEDAATGERRLGSGRVAALRGADKRLPEITGLIDPEQFDLIARSRPGFLVIRGAAGSGKTTVALHRIAYLAYDDPAIDSAQTLFVVFSPGLQRYVGHVLPGLGVEGVAISTYQDWAARQRRRHFPQLPGASRLEAPSLVQRMKLHPALGAALAQHVREVDGAPKAEQALDDWASVLLREDLLGEVFAREAGGSVGADDVRRFVEWNRRHNDELFRWLGGEPETEGALEPEDDALLLRAWQLRVGPLRGTGTAPLRYRHVAIDEVQDFSPLEVQVLLDCLDRDRSLTLAGDTQQHVVETSGFTSWGGFLEDLGVSGAEIETLRVSYRSSREILDFASSVLGPLREDEIAPEATRSGPPVELFRFTERGACVAFLADSLRRLAEEEPLASVALLTPSEEQSALYYEGLAQGDVPRLRRVQQQDFTFAPGVEVTEIDQAKGLEFDYVLVVEVGAEHFPDAPGARRLLHVAATRAVHQLWITSVGPPSPLVAGLAG